jgi:tetratricopeptide (TPR) repeat protein
VAEEESERRDEGAGHAAAALAFSGDPELREEARAYLRKQSELAEIQAEELREEKRLRHWSLRVRHISDVLKLAFELAVALLFLGIVFAIGVALWSAAHENGLVIDAFKVPPDLAAQGLSGDAVANALLDRLTAMQNDTDSSRAPSSYAKDWGNDIKVEIPDTGISIGEAYRLLVQWLGHQTHITGEVYHTAKGLALTARVAGDPGSRFEGNDFDTLVNQAAESVYRQTQPFRYAVYIASSHQNIADAYPRVSAVLQDLAEHGPASERPWAYTFWANAAEITGDMNLTLARARKAVALDPDLPLVQSNLANYAEAAGHDEEAYAAALALQRTLSGRGARLIIARAADAYRHEAPAQLAEQKGDYREAIAQYGELKNVEDFEGSHWNADQAIAFDLVFDHDLRGSRLVSGVESDLDFARLSNSGYGWQLANWYLTHFERFAAEGDWPAARDDMAAVLGWIGKQEYFPDTDAQLPPRYALALAMTGDRKGAWAEIAKSPLDCYVCLRMRGQIDAVQKNPNGAVYWFARAVEQAPQLPFAETDWGLMLLREGDYDAAIAKFAAANRKGPHFADPLEYWGEALIAKNRSDLALAKFAEAAQYAPNWGRLHLKWGEALYWLGKKDEAQKQFALAATLDLAQDERAQLARVTALHD